MTQLAPFTLLILLLAVLLAGLGAAFAWWNAEWRRVQRGLRHVLKEEPHALILAPGRGRGAGFNFTSNTMAVTWDAGAWCLIYRIDELQGVELVIDGQVAARTYRGETRRPLDIMGGADQQVILRLVFDDARYPDFLLELWSTADARKRSGLNPVEAVAEGNRWIARAESLFRRPAGGLAARPRTATRPPAPPPEAVELDPAPARRPAAPASPRQELPFAAAPDNDPPWDDQDDDEDDDSRLAR